MSKVKTIITASIFSLSFGLNCNVFSQILIIPEGSKALSISSFGGINLESNLGFTAYKLLRENYLSEQNKSELLNALREDSKFKYSQRLGFFVSTPYPLLRSKWYIGAGYTNIINLETNFPKNLASLLVNGNTAYKGKSLEMKDIYWKNLNYSKLTLGLSGNFSRGGTKHSIFAGGLLNLGHSFQNYSIDKLQLMTASNGENIDIILKGFKNESDTFYKSALSVSGLGAGFEFIHSIQIGKASFRYKISNLGFIKWQKNPHSWNRDTIYHFAGWDIPNIFEITEKPYHNSSDSLKTEIYGSPNPNMVTYTPSSFEIEYYRKSNGFLSGIGLYAAVYTHSNKNYAFCVYPRKQINSKIFVELLIGHSNISSLFSNLNFGYESKNHQIKLQLQSPENLVPGRFQKLNTGLIINYICTFKNEKLQQYR